MKTYFVTALLTVQTLSPASAQTIPTAGIVSQSCTQTKSESLVTAAIAAGLCTMLIRGYVDGMAFGVNRGLRAGFIEDPKNLATAGGINDVTARMQAIRPAAQCIPPDATIGQVAAAFVRYMARHPDRKDESYPAPFYDALVEQYCPPR